MTQALSFKLDHIYKGVLYLAESPEMSAKGMCKFGETRGTIAQRERGHTGQTTDDRSHIFYTRGSLDSPRAEDYARERFRELDLLVHPERSSRKELLWCRDLDQLKDVLQWAVETAPVRVGKVLTAHDRCELATADSAWSCLMGYLVDVQSKQHTLAHWMAQALLHPKVERRLADMGLECSYRDMRKPEFTLTRLFPRLEEWLISHGFKAEDLRDPEDGTFARVLDVITV